MDYVFLLCHHTEGMYCMPLEGCDYDGQLDKPTICISAGTFISSLGSSFLPRMFWQYWRRFPRPHSDKMLIWAVFFFRSGCRVSVKADRKPFAKRAKLLIAHLSCFADSTFGWQSAPRPGPRTEFLTLLLFYLEDEKCWLKTCFLIL